MFDSRAQPVQRTLIDVLSQNAALGANALRQPHRIIALARPDVGNGHAGTHARKIHHRGRLVAVVSFYFRGRFRA